MNRVVALTALAIVLVAAPVAAQESPVPGDLTSAKDTCWASASSWQTYETCVTDATVTTIDPGTYIVGAEVPPGTYKTPGVEEGGYACTAKRLSGFGGDSSEQLSFEYTKEGDGPLIVTIAATDAGFETEDCQPWVLVKAG